MGSPLILLEACILDVRLTCSEISNQLSDPKSVARYVTTWLTAVESVSEEVMVGPVIDPDGAFSVTEKSYTKAENVGGLSLQSATSIVWTKFSLD